MAGEIGTQGERAARPASVRDPAAEAAEGAQGVMENPSRGEDSPTPLSEPIPARRRAEPIKAPLWVGLAGALLIFLVAGIKPFIPAAAEGTLAAYWNKVLPLFFAEIGVAMVVAYIIGWGIDEQAKRREERIQEEREEEERLRTALERREAEIREERERQEDRERERRMTQDVFRGVLGIQHTSAYVQKVIESTLDQKIVRRTVTLMYKLTRLSPEDAAQLGVNANKFIYMDQAVTFEFENLSSKEQSVSVKFAVPVRHGPKLRDASGVISAIIGGEQQEVEAIDSDGHSDAKVYVWKKKIPPRGRLPVAVKARVIKEDSDSEVWSSYFPCTEGMSLQVTAPDDLHMGVRNNTASQELEEMAQGGNGMAIWKINGPILPNNSVVFYWRTAEHEGDVAVPPIEPNADPALEAPEPPVGGTDAYGGRVAEG